MAKRLIDADAMLETIHDTADGLADCDQQNAAWALRKYAVRDIMDAPTVDAVEVVRCRDCRWARTQDHREPTDTPKQFLICQCFMHHYIPAPWGARLAVEPDGFCSSGERRADDKKGIV